MCLSVQGPSADELKRLVQLEFIRWKQLAELERSDILNQSLAWWKAHQNDYPNIAHLAKKYLAIPATSAPSERVFSTASHIARRRRATMDATTLEKLVFLSKNAHLMCDVM